MWQALIGGGGGGRGGVHIVHEYNEYSPPPQLTLYFRPWPAAWKKNILSSLGGSYIKLMCPAIVSKAVLTPPS